MGEPDTPSEEVAHLQFDYAEFKGKRVGTATCLVCKCDIPDVYYEIGGQIACLKCKERVEGVISGGSPVRRFFHALLLGIAAGAFGAVLWYAVLKFLHMELGILALVVGILVGIAVKKGSSGRGGIPYQILGMFLTYTSIVVTYLPGWIEDLQVHGAGHDLCTIREMSVLLMYAFAAPVMAGFKNIIGMLIIGIALYEAWYINRRMEVAITGPYRVAEGHTVSATPSQGGT